MGCTLKGIMLDLMCSNTVYILSIGVLGVFAVCLFRVSRGFYLFLLHLACRFQHPLNHILVMLMVLVVVLKTYPPQHGLSLLQVVS